MPVLWTLIWSAAVAVASLAVLLVVSNGALDAVLGAVLVGALAVLARSMIRFASDPADPRGEDKRP